MRGEWISKHNIIIHVHKQKNFKKWGGGGAGIEYETLKRLVGKYDLLSEIHLKKPHTFELIKWNITVGMNVVLIIF